QGNQDVMYTHASPPNDRLCAYPQNSTQTMPASSAHAGGVNVLLGDGSVRFVSNGVSLATWRALGTRNGNDLLGDDFRALAGSLGRRRRLPQRLRTQLHQRTMRAHATMNQAFSKVVLAPGLALFLFLVSGCGKSLPPETDPDQARQALLAALDAWKE